MEKPELQSGALRLPAVPMVVFPHWREMLNRSRLSVPARTGYALAICGYLDYCRKNGLSATVQSARACMADAERRKPARNPQLWREALNWHFRQGQQTSDPASPGVLRAGRF